MYRIFSKLQHIMYTIIFSKGNYISGIFKRIKTLNNLLYNTSYRDTFHL